MKIDESPLFSNIVAFLKLSQLPEFETKCKLGSRYSFDSTLLASVAFNWITLVLLLDKSKGFL